jgi:NAD(P)-dependent dehydrogenase (short-subunit alcohol dehydrogenase family)
VLITADVGSEDSVQELVKGTIASYGRLDGAFNNAAIEQSNKPLADLTLAEWERVMRVDLTGVFLCMKHQIRAMLTSGGGAIVNTSSGAAQIAFPNGGEYVTAKAGVLGLTRSAAVDYGARGIRVNAILPGVIRTPMIARLSEDPAFAAMFDRSRQRHIVGRFGEPSEIGEAAKWLLSDASSFVQGAAISVDGGFLAN